MLPRKLVVGSCCAVLLVLFGLSGRGGEVLAASRSYTTMIEESAVQASRHSMSWSEDGVLGVQNSAGFGPQAIASLGAMPGQAAFDNDVLTLRLLFGAGPAVTGRDLAKTMAEMKEPPTASPLSSTCDSAGACTVATASTVPGPLWLIVSVLVGLLAVGMRRPRVAAA